MKIDILILHRTPQAFDMDIVSPSALAIHTDLDVVVLEDLYETIGGELAALVGIEDRR